MNSLRHQLWSACLFFAAVGCGQQPGSNTPAYVTPSGGTGGGGAGARAVTPPRAGQTGTATGGSRAGNPAQNDEDAGV
jgi:hypothetical protein